MRKKILKIEKKIKEIKETLLTIGEMRHGSLTRQYQKNKKRGYYQISYTHKMKSHTEYVRPEFVKTLKQEIIAFKLFKKCVDEWIDLAIEHSKLKIKLTKNQKRDQL